MGDGVGRYAQYKSLVQAAALLDDDIESTRLEQQRLAAVLHKHQAKVDTIAKKQRQQEQEAWARERDRRLEEICTVESVVAAMEKEQRELDEEELRLTAELDVLHEQQQQANETEAKKIYDLVHNSASLLDRELQQAQVDVAYLTQIVTTAMRKNGGQQDRDHEAMREMVATIQKRREDALREATAQFQARLHSFELEKEALRKRTEELQWRKQRALQVLSQNQQQVLQGFFTTPRAAMQTPNPTLPSLAYSEIVEAMTQPMGAVVSQLQGEKSARRSDPLAEAQRHLEMGPARLQVLEQSVREREQQALRLNLAGMKSYDGRWSVETYRVDQYEIVYFVRTLVFDWMEKAVEISNAQPEKQVLEMEIKRFEASRAVREERAATQRSVDCAIEIAWEIYDEVVREIAQSIHRELQYTATQVRGLVLSEVKAAMFSPSQPPKASLREALFMNAWSEQRRKDHAGSVYTFRPRLQMTPATATRSASTATTAATPSPTKKRRGFFSSGQKTKPQLDSVTSAAPAGKEEMPGDSLPRVLIKSAVVTPDTQQGRAVDEAIWRRMAISFTTFSSLPSCSVVSCIQFSSRGELLAVGTVDDEVVVYSVHTDRTPASSTAIRITPPTKKYSSTLISRITRLCFSGCGRSLITYNQQKAATVWSLVAAPATAHSSDCFPVDSTNVKPTPLELITKLQPAELFAEPPVPTDVLDFDVPVVAARLRAGPAPSVSAVNFFSAISVLGEQPYLLCGSSNGDVLKIPCKGVGNALGHHAEAAFDAPTPTDTELRYVGLGKPPSSTIKREFFRQAHRHPVLFISSLPAALSMNHSPRLLSIDQHGGVAMWIYTRQYFTGFGWFVPHNVYQLDLQDKHPGSEWDILQIQLAADRQRLVLMLFKPAPGHASVGRGTIKFLQLNVSIHAVTDESIGALEVDLVGSVPPRFTLLTVPRKASSTTRSDPQPKRDKLYFIILLMDNALHVFSLQTGDRCQAPIPLTSPSVAKGRAKPSAKDTAAVYTSITSARASSSGSSGCITTLVAVAGELHRQIRVYRLELAGTVT